MTSLGTPQRSALILVRSPVTRDPRVRRQIEWLSSDGFVIDTVGLPGHHVDGVRRHFGLKRPGFWSRLPFAYLLTYALVPMQQKFRILMGNAIPAEARRDIARGEYDLIVFNDHHFMPLVGDKRTFTRRTVNTHVHLDLHEYVAQDTSSTSLFNRIAGRYWRWQRRFIGHDRFDSRSTVSEGISRLYAAEFGVPEPAVVVNAPPHEEQEPSPVAESIQLVHHGAAAPQRGIFALIDAMKLVDSRFTLTLILVGDQSWIERFRNYAEPLGDRVRFADAVQMPEISRAINVYDVEVMFFPPVNRSLELALPNKFFEAIQGRLAILIGPRPLMAPLVERMENGVVAAGWDTADLAAAIDELTVERVAEFKTNSHKHAPAYSDIESRRTFRHAVTSHVSAVSNP